MYKQAIVNNLIKIATAITNDNPDYIGYAIDKYHELNRLKNRIGTVEGLLDTLGNTDKLLTQDMDRRAFIGLTIPGMNTTQQGSIVYKKDDVLPTVGMSGKVSNIVSNKLKSINMNRRQFLSPVLGSEPNNLSKPVNKTTAVALGAKKQPTANAVTNKPKEQAKMSRRQFLFPFGSK